MLYIAICDDEPVFAGMLERSAAQALRSVGLQGQCEQFTSPQGLLAAKPERFDIVFLDVEIGCENGVEAAYALRAVNPRAALVFVTGHVEYAPDGYKVGALRYLLKERLSVEFAECFAAALEHCRRWAASLTVETAAGPQKLPLRELVYIESRRHMCQFFMYDHGALTQHQAQMNISALEKQLEPEGFLRVQKGYLVNMRHILQIRNYQVRLPGGVQLKASERRYAEIKGRYLRWKGEQTE